MECNAALSMSGKINQTNKGIFKSTDFCNMLFVVLEKSCEVLQPTTDSLVF